MDSEQRLLSRIHNGERGAQKELYTRLAGAAMAVAMRMVADEEAARDVTLIIAARARSVAGRCGW